MYFRINAVMHTKTEMNASQSKIAWCNWYIETGDTKRQGGANATIFEF